MPIKPIDPETTTPADMRPRILDGIMHVYNNYGKYLGWQEARHAPRVEIGETVMNLESGGLPLMVGDSPDNPGVGPAVGPMQVTAGGMEAEWFRDASGERVTTDWLRDTDNNIRVGMLGLGKRMEVISAQGYPDWFLAGAGYFGCNVREDGSLDPNEGDVVGTIGTNCVQYHRTLKAYVEDTFGPETVASLEKGEWTDTSSLRTISDWKKILEDIPTAVIGTVVDPAVDVLMGILDAIKGAAPRVGLAVGGIALAAIGLITLSKS